MFFFAVITAILGYLLFPVFNAIFIAVILSGIFLPVNDFIHRKLGFSTGLSAGTTCLLVTLLIIVPFLYVASQLTFEAYQVFAEQRQWFEKEKLGSLFLETGFILVHVNEVLDYFGFHLDSEGLISLLSENGNEISQFFINLFRTSITNTFSYTFSIIFDFLVMVLVMFGIFNQGKKLKRFLFYMIPLNPYRSKIVLRKFNQMNFVTLIVNGIGGIIQGSLAGLAFLLCGFESVLLWTFIMMVLAFIPLLGMSIIYIPRHPDPALFRTLRGGRFPGRFLLGGLFRRGELVQAEIHRQAGRGQLHFFCCSASSEG